MTVLILFFNRPEALRGLFEIVRQARPEQLLLYQDGPRSEADLPALQACRRVVEHVDWPCQVRRNYQTENHGCDPANYLSQRWAFTLTDRCIFFEDDDRPSLSFFPFCQELLERYKDDPRVGLITGTNYDQRTTDCPDSYFFTSAFNINGFATWRRVYEVLDDHYSFLDDPWATARIASLVRAHRHQQNFLPFCRYHRSVGKAYYETILHAAMFLTSALSIVPSVNLVSNLGATAGGVHLSGTNDCLPRDLRRIFQMPALAMDFPLRHPRYLIDNVDYKERLFRTQGWGHPWIKLRHSLEELWLNLRHGDLRRIRQALANRLRIWRGRSRWD